MASYQWNEAETEATKVAEEGIENVRNSGHDIPSKAECLQCHGTYSLGGGRPSRGLGFSAIQLSHSDSETTLQTLIDSDLLSRNPAHAVSFPGTGTTRDALGYLHANCGNCHNDSRDGLPQSDLNLWVSVDDNVPEETGAYQTAIGKPSLLFTLPGIEGLVVAGEPSKSAIIYRMGARGNIAQMPPIATKSIDADGLSIVHSWVEGLQ